MNNSNNTKRIVVTAMFCAIAFLMTFLFRFKVSFLTFDFKDAIISIVSLLYGPIYGVVSAGLVAIFEFLSVSDTGVYGLIMNFISSSVFALSCGLIYKFKRSFGGAIFAVATAVVSVTAIMLVANFFITPIYMGVERTDVVRLIPALLLPFNLSKSIINGAALLLIYKPITTALKKSGLVKVSSDIKYGLSKKTIWQTVISALVLAISVLFILLVLKGDFALFK